MPTVTSKDGTSIAYEQSGQGPALILVDGALCHRAFGPMRPLAALLASRFTVYAYDRRGRGESGNILPFAVERGIEDIAALIDAAGGSTFSLRHLLRRGPRLRGGAATASHRHKGRALRAAI